VDFEMLGRASEFVEYVSVRVDRRLYFFLVGIDCSKFIRVNLPDSNSAGIKSCSYGSYSHDYYLALSA